jgi:predicted nucleic acid-binding protein
MSLVLDGSATVAWLIPDERTAASQRVLDQVGDNGAIVPMLWRLEIGNALLLAVRRKRMSKPDRAEALSKLSDLPIEIDTETFIHAWASTLALADRFNLTLYDACYLELAQRRGLPLATLDKDLRKAAKALDIPLLGI